MTKQCEQCGKEFKSHNHSHRFCTKKCSETNWWLRRKSEKVHFTCKHCGKQFDTYAKSRRLYCSSECADESQFKASGLKKEREITETQVYYAARDYVLKGRSPRETAGDFGLDGKQLEAWINANRDSFDRECEGVRKKAGGYSQKVGLRFVKTV